MKMSKCNPPFQNAAYGPEYVVLLHVYDTCEASVCLAWSSYN